MSNLAAVLTSGWMPEHARQFNLVETPDSNIHARLPQEVRASIRGVACRARIDSQFMTPFPT